MVLFAIPVATFGRVDLGSEVEVNVYPIGPKGIQSDSNPAIGKAMVPQWCYSAQGSPLLNAVCVA